MKNNKQTRLLPMNKASMPAIENYPLPKIGRARRIASIVYKEEPLSSQVILSGARVYRKEDYTAYRDALGWLIKGQLGGEWDTRRYSFGVRVRFFLGNRRKVDIDNLLKPIMDAGTHIVWADDSQVTEIYAIVLREQPDPGVEVLIYTIEDFVDFQHYCLYCGKELHGREGFGKGLASKFCSVQCHDNVQRQGKERVCEECGTAFWSGRYKGKNRKVNKRFCCRACWDAWVKKHGKEQAAHIRRKRAGVPISKGAVQTVLMPSVASNTHRPDITAGRVLELYNQDLLVKDIARTLGCSQWTIGHRLREAGISKSKCYSRSRKLRDILVDPGRAPLTVIDLEDMEGKENHGTGEG